MVKKIVASSFDAQVRLRCAASGVPAPTIRWLKDGRPVAQAPRPAHLAPYRERPAQQQLRIPGLTYRDEGNYTCVVENPYGELSHTFRLEVQNYLDHR